MSCDAVREVLPLVPDSAEADVTLVEQHVAHCESCRELHEAYEADARLLEGLGRGRTVPAGLMDGFSQSVLEAVARDDATAAPLAAAEPSRPRGEVIRFPAGAAVAAAAALLLAVTLSVAVRPADEGSAGPTADGDRATPQPSATAPDVQLAADDAAADDAAAPEAPLAADTLPAPRLRGDPAPMPRRSARRRGRDVVPVGQGQGQRGRGRVAVQDLLQQTLPGLRRFFQRPEDREDEVRF